MNDKTPEQMAEALLKSYMKSNQFQWSRRHSTCLLLDEDGFIRLHIGGYCYEPPKDITQQVYPPEHFEEYAASTVTKIEDVVFMGKYLSKEFGLPFYSISGALDNTPFIDVPALSK